ncbi:hypothetical protein BXZ70DRAFT_114106 [Cristinia sonorae]|uniref:Uncharacterized protein n=1 Tax=Cristinia sonorae TaxID=1940300 RepID=A0A8K0XQX7_9AGAR|nr:hypothetical protein BXZ70DRAFT_114106 [Cristinia sonorae]
MIAPPPPVGIPLYPPIVLRITSSPTDNLTCFTRRHHTTGGVAANDHTCTGTGTTLRWTFAPLPAMPSSLNCPNLSIQQHQQLYSSEAKMSQPTEPTRRHFHANSKTAIGSLKNDPTFKRLLYFVWVSRAATVHYQRWSPKDATSDELASLFIPHHIDLPSILCDLVKRAAAANNKRLTLPKQLHEEFSDVRNQIKEIKEITGGLSWMGQEIQAQLEFNHRLQEWARMQGVQL